MSPHRERGPQEVTPVRLVESAPRGHAPVVPAPVARLIEPFAAAPPPPGAEEIARDVVTVRRRLLATVAYGVGTFLVASTLQLGDWSDGGAMVPALGLAAFCALGAAAGTLWTWLGARRLGDAGVSIFDALDGSWKAAAEQAARASLAPPRERIARVAAAPGPRALPEAHRIPASPDVLASRWGAAVRQAVDDRAAVAHLVAELGPADRDMIPDVLPSADALVARIGELAATLHELDRDAPPSLVTEVEARLAAARAAVPAEGAPTPDQARRLDLLQRQLETLADLATRRGQLAERLDSAALVLQTMRLDLLRLRSAGIDSALGELTAMTRDAGTLSQDIGRALDVAEEIRKAEG